MAESKPTKLQMAKEIQHLIAAAQDMSAVMDLEPPIKTDYLIDLKNKKVTVSHLNNVVANLQADIKKDASMIEPGDKFHQDTHRVLADLNVKMPRPAADETIEDEDDVMPTSSPSPGIPDEDETEEVVEEEKPIKKEKKNAAGTTEKIKKGRDKFGFKIGSIISNLAHGLEDNPMTAKEVKNASFNNGREQHGNLRKFIKMGIATKTEDGKIMVKVKS